MSTGLLRRAYDMLLVAVKGVVAVLTDHPTRSKAGRCILPVLALLAGSCSGPPSAVESITIINPTAYDLDVDVTDGDRGGWLPLTVVEAMSEDVAQEVIDQGEVWIFRFRHFGEPVGEMALTRSELERNDWRVEVPAEVEERLQQLGRPTAEEVTSVDSAGGGGK